MIRVTIILIFAFKFDLTFGQIPQLISDIFFELPLNSSGQRIYSKILSDQRFTQREMTHKYEEDKKYPTFLGNSSDQGVVSPKADSTEFEMNWEQSLSILSKTKTKFYNIIFLKITYYFPSKDTAEQEYQKLNKALASYFTNTSEFKIDTVFSDSPDRSKYKAHGISYDSADGKYELDVLSATLANNHFALTFKYKRLYSHFTKRYKHL